MRSRVVVALALTALAGCRVEGDRAKAVASPAEQESLALARGRTMPGPSHTVFDRKREVVAPGLARVTVSAIVRMDQGPDSARNRIEALLAAERQADTTVAAIRILAYLPPPAGHGTGPMKLVPLAFSDWAPEPGFDSLGVATRHRPYRTEMRFVHDAATLEAMGLGPARPGTRSPHGAMPPGHPVPPRQP